MSNILNVSRALKIVGIVLVVALAPTPVSAQPDGLNEPEMAEPSPEQITAAREHYALGKKFHDAKDYPSAAEEYLKAYEIYPQPLFLYNAGQVKRLAGDNEGAIELYERYLAADSDGPGAANTKQLLVELRKSVAEAKKAREKQEKHSKENPEAPPQDPIVPAIVAPETAKPIAPADIIAPATPVEHGSNGRGLKIVGASTVAIGVVALGVGAFYGVKAQSKNDEVSKYQGVWTPTQDALYNDGESANTKMLIATSIGGAALVTGAIMYFLGSRKGGRSEHVSVTPLLNEQQAGLSLSGAF